MIAWHPTDKHGTSLAAFDPDDPMPDYSQVGICYCTSPRLATIHARYGDMLREGGGPFQKRRTDADSAAEEAAQEFIEHIISGVHEREDDS